MLSLQIKPLKNATTLLFTGTAFDSFQTTEAVFHGAANYIIDGHVNSDFFSDEDKPGTTFLAWSLLRPICFQMIRGKRIPLFFRIVFYLSKDEAATLFSEPLLSQNSDIEGYHLIFHFKNNQLYARTGTSFLRFSMDKHSEQIWDCHIKSWLFNHGISFEEE